MVDYVIRPTNVQFLHKGTVFDSQAGIFGPGANPLRDNLDTSYVITAKGPDVQDVATMVYESLPAELDTATVTNLRYTVRFMVPPETGDVLQIFNQVGVCTFVTATQTAEYLESTGTPYHPQPAKGQVITLTSEVFPGQSFLLGLYAGFFQSDPSMFAQYVEASYSDTQTVQRVKIIDEYMTWVADPIPGYDPDVYAAPPLDGSGNVGSGGSGGDGGDNGGGGSGGGLSGTTPTWWDGNAEVPSAAATQRVTWFDGNDENPAYFEGWWDGTTVQPLAP